MKQVVRLVLVFILAYNVAEAIRIQEDLKKGILLIERDVGGRSISQGAGFIIIKTSANEEFHYLVTAKHVVDDADTIYLRCGEQTKRGEVRIGSKRVMCDLSRGYSGWKKYVKENIDIVVIPLVRQMVSEQIYFTSFGYEQLATENIIDSLKINEGDEIILMGFPFTQPHDRPYYHVVRTGIISLLTRDTIFVPLRNKNLNENIYLIDAPIFGGESGTPVFVVKGRVSYILGIIFADYKKSEKGKIHINDTTSVDFSYYYPEDLGFVFPAQRIKEMIDAVEKEIVSDVLKKTKSFDEK